MAKLTIKQPVIYNSLGTVVFCCQRSWWNFSVVTPKEGVKCRWDRKNCVFLPVEPQPPQMPYHRSCAHLLAEHYFILQWSTTVLSTKFDHVLFIVHLSLHIRWSWHEHRRLLRLLQSSVWIWLQLVCTRNCAGIRIMWLLQKVLLMLMHASLALAIKFLVIKLCSHWQNFSWQCSIIPLWLLSLLFFSRYFLQHLSIDSLKI